MLTGMPETLGSGPSMGGGGKEELRECWPGDSSDVSIKTSLETTRIYDLKKKKN